MNLGPTHSCKWCQRPIERWSNDHGRSEWRHFGDNLTSCQTVASPLFCKMPDLADVHGASTIRRDIREKPADISWATFETLRDGPPAAAFFGLTIIGLALLVASILVHR